MSGRKSSRGRSRLTETKSLQKRKACEGSQFATLQGLLDDSCERHRVSFVPTTAQAFSINSSSTAPVFLRESSQQTSPSGTTMSGTVCKRTVHFALCGCLQGVNLLFVLLFALVDLCCTTLSFAFQTTRLEATIKTSRM